MNRDDNIRKHERIATLEKVQKEVKILGYAGNSDIVKWLEQQLKEAKGDD